MKARQSKDVQKILANPEAARTLVRYIKQLQYSLSTKREITVGGKKYHLAKVITQEVNKS
ncbi:MAG: hypothetical protein AAF824_14105 [Bacteroidota bacterium]